MADSVNTTAAEVAFWDPFPFDLELGFPVALTSGLVGTPSRLALSTPEGGQMLASNPFDSPNAAGSGRSETWPYPRSSKNASEALDVFVRRRFLETLYLPDVSLQSGGIDQDFVDIQALYTLPSFVSDLTRIKVASSPEAASKHPLPDLLAPFFLPLPAIEGKYRKLLPPYCTRSLNLKAIVEVPNDSQLAEDELRVLETGAAFRRGCKAAEVDATMTMGKKWAEELERREVFLQIIMTLLYIACIPKPEKALGVDGEVAELAKKKSKKRKRKDQRPVWEAVTDDPKMAVELLTDRLSIWQAVSDLGIGDALPASDSHKSKGKAKAKDTHSDRVRRFFDEVLAKHFLKSHYSFCKNFHLKLFGSTLPSRRPAGEVPPPLKKARKASDLLPPASTAGLTRTVSSREVLSRDQRGSSRSAASPPPPPNGMRRSTSVVSLNPPESRRSRSESIDPYALEPPPPKRSAGLTRHASGKNLFQGREVGLMRRTGSAVISKTLKEKEKGGGESQQKLPLQRQNSLGMLTRRPSESWRNLAGTLPAAASSTLVHATPVKPKFQAHARPTVRNPFFKSHPTPIKEEASFVAETPIAPSRHGKTVPSLGAGRLLSFGEVSGAVAEEHDDLGDLMYDTEEDEEGGGGMDRDGGIPETPMKG